MSDLAALGVLLLLILACIVLLVGVVILYFKLAKIFPRGMKFIKNAFLLLDSAFPMIVTILAENGYISSGNMNFLSLWVLFNMIYFFEGESTGNKIFIVSIPFLFSAIFSFGFGYYSGILKQVSKGLVMTEISAIDFMCYVHMVWCVLAFVAMAGVRRFLMKTESKK